ncbi:hypothetical protein E4O03_10960 [Treponema sp. OMZ 792]|uniref:hypothetical protein n=1 Tax=unclassified Treponema TaxID=2638727 RepID=UPI0020A29506|nr:MULTISPECIES: hypothetical protein [unclassified Treponema]UTC74707.1 hypothetical protein E4O03_10960 [Treponema sp. OMZ 792]UTC81101.1 hypothetical protein E4O07_10860 [Treponema sp. OMZ 798]
MCKECDDIDTAFKNAQENPHKSFMPIYELLLSKIENKQLKIYAGDCKFKDMLKIIDEELHFTVCFYLQCPACGIFYFFGVCIRGAPVYKKLENITKKEIENIIWGKEGTFFKTDYC